MKEESVGFLFNVQVEAVPQAAPAVAPVAAPAGLAEFAAAAAAAGSQGGAATKERHAGSDGVARQGNRRRGVAAS